MLERIPRVRRWAAAIEAATAERVGTSAGGLLARTPVLVLHTTGRRSGRARRTTVAVHEEADGSLVLVGGAGGQARIPDWVANLRTDPDVEVTRHRRRVPVHAVELAGGDRAAAWPALVATWPRIATYERRAGRPVPIFRLRPR